MKEVSPGVLGMLSYNECYQGSRGRVYSSCVFSSSISPHLPLPSFTLSAGVSLWDILGHPTIYLFPIPPTTLQTMGYFGPGDIPAQAAIQ